MQQDPHAHQAQPQHDQEQHEQQQADPAQQWLAQPHNPAAFDAAFLEAFADSIELDGVQAKHSQLSRLKPARAEGWIEKDKRLNELAHREKQLRQRLHQGTKFASPPIPDLPPAPTQPAAPHTPQRGTRLADQESAILQAIDELGYHPKRLPIPQRGVQGVKSRVRQALKKSPLFTGAKTFDKAWQRLRDELLLMDESEGDGIAPP